jgi:hypothetical protein
LTLQKDIIINGMAQNKSVINNQILKFNNLYKKYKKHCDRLNIKPKPSSGWSINMLQKWLKENNYGNNNDN